MQKVFLLISAVTGALSVMIGAFGAHGLSKLLNASGRTDTFETAVKYQFYHSLGIFMLALLMFQLQHRFLVLAGWSFLAGIIIFSGSLYLLCLTNIRWLGAITPVGGLLFIAGWVLLGLAVAKF